MDAQEIRSLGPRLEKFLEEFDNAFFRTDTRAHLPTYVEGQLSGLPRKSVEPIALRAHVPPRTLQNFLSVLKWDEGLMRDRVAEIVLRDHFHSQAVGIIDETSDGKQGAKTPGVQRQYCGSSGKVDNCIVTVHLAYANPDFHCLLDGELFLPQSWSDDRPRCRQAGIPDETLYRPKWKIALELLDRARANGVSFAWLTFDEGYGGKPDFLRELSRRGQPFVAEVPKSLTGWITVPETTERAYRRRGRGSPRRTPRLKSGETPAQSVEHHLLHSPAFHRQKWVPYRIKDGDKGPLIWQAKHAEFHLPDENGLPGPAWHLIVARNPLDGEIKFFLDNAPPGVKVTVRLLVAFSRWKVERCFEDQKGEIGLDHYEGRSWKGLLRHLILSSVSYLFLAKVRRELGGKKSGAHRLSGSRSRRLPDTLLVA